MPDTAPTPATTTSRSAPAPPPALDVAAIDWQRAQFLVSLLWQGADLGNHDLEMLEATLADAQAAADHWQCEADRQADRAAFLDQEHTRLAAEHRQVWTVLVAAHAFVERSVPGQPWYPSIIGWALAELPQEMRDRLEAEAREGEATNG